MSTIGKIEQIQSQLAKSVLGLPQCAPNVCAQTELGLKPFRVVLWQHQLNFYLRLLCLPRERWVSRVLQEHLSGSWHSPYIAYITRVREQVGLLEMPPTSSILNRIMEQWSVECVNQRISLLSLPSVGELTRFERQSYVYEHQGLSILAQFRLGCAGLGNKQSRFGALRLKRCPLCCQLLDELHVAFTCMDLEKFRKFHT